MNLIVYTKAGCHLCTGLLEKLETIKEQDWSIETRDINTNAAWLAQYEYEVPVLYQKLAPDIEQMIPRPAPRLSPSGLKTWLEKYAQNA